MFLFERVDHSTKQFDLSGVLVLDATSLSLTASLKTVSQEVQVLARPQPCWSHVQKTDVIVRIMTNVRRLQLHVIAF